MFTEDPKNVTARLGDTVSFRCTIYPPVQVYWIVNGFPLISNSSYEFKYDELTGKWLGKSCGIRVQLYGHCHYVIMSCRWPDLCAPMENWSLSEFFFFFNFFLSSNVGEHEIIIKGVTMQRDGSYFCRSTVQSATSPVAVRSQEARLTVIGNFNIYD